MHDPANIERKLAAIFSADVAGYSRLMAEDEVATLQRLTAARELISGRRRLWFRVRSLSAPSADQQ
jgi:hypothetical protein